jgi:tetratricopeptide (TPR) repeat protein
MSRLARVVRVAAGLALVLGIASPALADTPPTKWDRAKNPSLADSWDLHVRIRQELTAAGLERREESLETTLSEVRDELEQAGAATSPDVRLRFDLGEIYVDLKHYPSAIQVLVPALALAPDDPAAVSAWGELAVAYAKLDQSREEVRAYDEVLARSMSLFERALMTANRAEAEMRLGNLDEAVAGYREAIALSESVSGLSNLFKQNVLARWGLAVALDRSGDPSGALREAALAASQNGFNALKDPDVFFVPDYEVAFYYALGWTALAQKPPNAKDGLELWGRAEDEWSLYLRGAESAQADCDRVRTHPCAGDRWLSLVRAHLDHAKRERVLAEKHAGLKRTPPLHLGHEIMIR